MPGQRLTVARRRPLSRTARRIAAGATIVLLLVPGTHALRLAPRIVGYFQVPEHWFLRRWSAEYRPSHEAVVSATSDREAAILRALADAAATRAAARIVYDPSYVEIAYPGGDVAADRGVCTDLVVRALRDVGVDLQRDVHVDMSAHFAEYPAIWGSEAPDSNIDHRRVPNLMVLFARHGQVLAITDRPEDYGEGDIVTWDLGRGMTHIGIVTRSRAAGSARPMVAHHVGGNPTVDDVLFAWRIVGHFRYLGLPTR